MFSLYRLVRMPLTAFCVTQKLQCSLNIRIYVMWYADFVEISHANTLLKTYLSILQYSQVFVNDLSLMKKSAHWHFFYLSCFLFTDSFNIEKWNDEAN